MEIELQNGNGQTRSSASIEEQTLLHLYRTVDYFQRAYEQAIKPHGLTPTQYNALRILRGAGQEGLRCSEIAQRQISHDPDITRLLDRLARQKYVRRRRGSKDRRVVLTFITDAGLAKLKAMDPLVESTTRRAMKAYEAGAAYRTDSPAGNGAVTAPRRLEFRRFRQRFRDDASFSCLFMKLMVQAIERQLKPVGHT